MRPIPIINHDHHPRLRLNKQPLPSLAHPRIKSQRAFLGSDSWILLSKLSIIGGRTLFSRVEAEGLPCKETYCIILRETIAEVAFLFVELLDKGLKILRQFYQ